MSDRVDEIHRSVLAKTVHELKESGVEGGSPDESYMTRGALLFFFDVTVFVAFDDTRDRPKNVDVTDHAVTPVQLGTTTSGGTTMMETKVTTFMILAERMSLNVSACPPPMKRKTSEKCVCV